MCAVAKRLGRGSAASTKRHTLFDWIRISIGVLQFNSPFDDVGAVLDDLNCYFSHGGNLNDKSRITQVRDFVMISRFIFCWLHEHTLPPQIGRASCRERV